MSFIQRKRKLNVKSTDLKSNFVDDTNILQALDFEVSDHSPAPLLT
jgi:hypothetical protein